MAEVVFEGKPYPVSDTEPPQLRGLELCQPFFAAALTAWLDAAQAYLNRKFPYPGMEDLGRYVLRAGETRRSLERQVFLYSRGRIPDSGSRIRSNTLDSRHRWGLAVDLYASDEVKDELVWDDDPDGFWARLFLAVPPRAFGLRDILPLEYVHLELVEADLMIARAAEFGLVQS